jgi:hypothetical protein
LYSAITPHGKRVRADDDVGLALVDELAQIGGRVLADEAPELRDVRGPFGAIVDEAVDLRNGLDHADVAVRDDLRKDAGRVLVRIDRLRLDRRIEREQSRAHGLRRGRVADADGRREKQNPALQVSSGADSSASTKKSSRISCASSSFSSSLPFSSVTTNSSAFSL